MAGAVSSSTKNPIRVEIGRRAMRKRWSDPETRTTVRLTDLTREQRAVVLALVDAARAQQSPEAA